MNLITKRTTEGESSRYGGGLRSHRNIGTYRESRTRIQRVWH